MQPIKITNLVKASLEARRDELDRRIDALKLQVEGSEGADDTALLDQLARERDQIATSLANATVIDDQPFDTEAIEIGDTVTIRGESGETERYILVDETHGARVEDDWVSVTSPLGAALLGRSKGAEFEVEAPVGTTTYVVLAFERGPHRGVAPRSRHSSSA